MSDFQQGYLSKASTLFATSKIENAAHSGFYLLTRGSLKCYKTENKVYIIIIINLIIFSLLLPVCFIINI